MCNFNDNPHDDKNESEILCSFFIGAVIASLLFIALVMFVGCAKAKPWNCECSTNTGTLKCHGMTLEHDLSY